MPNPSVAVLALLASATAASAPLPADRSADVQLAQVTLRDRLVLRIPNMPIATIDSQRNLSAAEPQRWVEKKGPSCIEADKLGGAIVNGNFIDLVMRGGTRIRAILGGECAALGYYGGVYFKPSRDGRLCAGRDSIRTRSGDTCTIRQFRKLVPGR